MTEQWAEADRRLERLTPADAKDIDEVAAKGYLAEIRAAHKAYGEAIGVAGVVAPLAPARSVRDSIRSVTEAIQDYAIQILAAFPPRDPANEPTVITALAPIARHRERSRREPAPAEAAPPPASSIPALPAAPTT